MIRIEKPSKLPNTLLKQGAAQTRKDEVAYDNDPAGYRSGEQKFQVKNTIYKSVQQVQFNAQHGKCCYCEAKFGATSYRNVEHYRPKGAVKQSDTSNKEYPGYYWLAYDWDNLLVSCTVCNNNKSTLFPLEDETMRARSHHDNIQDEKPLIINPAIDDPREHIFFHREEPRHVTERGLKTIESLKLRRPDLQESRRERLTVLEVLRDLIIAEENSDNPNMQDQTKRAKEYLKTAIGPKAQFSSMTQDFLRS